MATVPFCPKCGKPLSPSKPLFSNSREQWWGCPIAPPGKPAAGCGWLGEESAASRNVATQKART